MTLNVRKTPDALINALVVAANQRQLDAISTFFHLTQFETTNSDYANPTLVRPTAPAAVTVDTDAWALLSTIVPQISSHFADQNAHDTVASTATTYTSGDPIDTASAVLVVNDIKAKLNTHFTQAGAHFTDDNTNTVTNADSTDDATMQLLLNEIVIDLYAHWASAPAGTIINAVPA